MSIVYKAGETIPEMDGNVKSGVAIVVESPDEMEGLQVLCTFAGKPNEDRMQAIFSALMDSDLNLSSWVEWKNKRGVFLGTANEDKNYDTADDADILSELLRLVRTIWQNQPIASDKLVLALVVADPSFDSYPTIELEINNPALVYYKGTVKTMIFTGVLSTPAWCLLFLTGKGGARTEHAEDLVARLRDTALKAGKTPLLKLQEIDQWSDKELPGKKTMVVFVHGLMSTDIGTFEGLVKKLQVKKEEGGLVMAGFPHNTLVGIDVNGAKLAEFFRKITEETSIEARLASAPSELIAMCLTGMGMKYASGITAIADVLSFHSIHNAFPGVNDLCRPTLGTDDEFLTRLEGKERQGKRQFKILAVGSRHQEQGLSKWMYNSLHGNEEHDGIVELTSSLPLVWPKQLKISTNCDHFHYFEENEPSLTPASNFLGNLLYGDNLSLD
ncbi:MAG: hypothetical protein HYR94_30770 [Chloroflexi bacterium]|nr:hypothetical protein [Chloroflexota bacterium]